MRLSLCFFSALVIVRGRMLADLSPTLFLTPWEPRSSLYAAAMSSFRGAISSFRCLGDFFFLVGLMEEEEVVCDDKREVEDLIILWKQFSSCFERCFIRVSFQQLLLLDKTVCFASMIQKGKRRHRFASSSSSSSILQTTQVFDMKHGGLHGLLEV
jgi:hypothetical protein